MQENAAQSIRENKIFLAACPWAPVAKFLAYGARAEHLRCSDL